MTTRIKTCGMTRVEDTLLAAKLGVDAIGLIFYESSPRFVTAEKAAAIVNALPPFITAVGVFVNAEPAFIKNILQDVQLDLLQFHGNESAAACRIYHRPYIKAVQMAENVDLRQIAANYPDAKALLLDTHQTGKFGGTGQVFDWNKIPQDLNKPIILAGGLTAENVADAILKVKPYGVDVTSGIEAAKGIKDHAKMRMLIQAVKKLG